MWISSGNRKRTKKAYARRTWTLNIESKCRAHSKIHTSKQCSFPLKPYTIVNDGKLEAPITEQKTTNTKTTPNFLLKLKKHHAFYNFYVILFMCIFHILLYWRELNLKWIEYDKEKLWVCFIVLVSIFPTIWWHSCKLFTFIHVYCISLFVSYLTFPIWIWKEMEWEILETHLFVCMLMIRKTRSCHISILLNNHEKKNRLSFIYPFCEDDVNASIC